jgi:hypothetical protein
VATVNVVGRRCDRSSAVPARTTEAHSAAATTTGFPIDQAEVRQEYVPRARLALPPHCDKIIRAVALLIAEISLVSRPRRNERGRTSADGMFFPIWSYKMDCP